MEAKAITLIAVVLGLGLMPLVSVVLRRRKASARRSRRREIVACPHLGSASDPLVHQQHPAEEHRCYFQMQRDRVDLDHQQTFCLSREHARCPWLVAVPASGRARVAGSGGSLPSPARTFAPALGVVRQMVHWAGLRLLVALRWTVRHLLRAARWLGRGIASAARAGGRRVPGAWLHVERAALAVWTWTEQRAAPALARAARRAAVAAARDTRRGLLALGLAMLALARSAHVGARWIAHRVAQARSRRPQEVTAEPLVVADPPQLVAEPEAVPAASLGELLARGIAALEADKEDLAYELFVQACRANAREARAWFWRAKTAPSLQEMIESLERAATLAPDNAQVQVNLGWARARQERERSLRAMREQAKRPAALAARAATTPAARQPAFAVRRLANLLGLLASSVAGVACLAIGALWIAGALPGQALAGLNPAAGWLQKLTPQLDLVALGGSASLEILGGYDLLTAVPFALGFLALLGAGGLLRGEDWARWWAPVVAVASVGLWLNYASVALPAQLLIGLGTLVAVGGPLGAVKGEAQG